VSEEKRFEELHKLKLNTIDKIPYDITKNIPAKVLTEMTLTELEKLKPEYKPPKEKKELIKIKKGENKNGRKNRR